MFRPLTGIYEPSAIQQLPDGRFLVVEDEKQHPFCLLTLAADGDVAAVTPLDRSALPVEDSFRKLDDLEGLTIDATGYLYAITSHSRDGDGDEKKSRDRLVRFRVAGDRPVDTRVSGGLKDALITAHPVLAAAAAVRDVKNEGGLNIEALECTPDGRALLVGLRSPLLDGRALIARVENLAALFEADAVPRIASLTTLDLGGDGLRGMAWIPALAGYLLVSGPAARAQVQFKLWFWNGQADAPPHRITVSGLAGFEHAEGISVAGRHIIIVSDDGDREAGRAARYLLLAPEQLQIAA